MAHSRWASRFNGGRNDFNSSGQIPLDLVASGALDRFGYMDPSDGGKVRNGTGGVYYRKNLSASDTLRVDGYVTRSLFDLFSDFTFFLSDPVNGDGIQQHDSRLQEGANAQYIHASTLQGIPALLMAGGNLGDNWINVDLFHDKDRQIIAPSRQPVDRSQCAYYESGGVRAGGSGLTASAF